MPLDLLQLCRERHSEKYELFDRYLNGQLVRVLRTIGFDVDYVRGEGPHLFDADGNRYLDLLSGFGTFAIGRNHPTVIGALKQVLDAGFPSLVQMDVSLLAGLLAERLVTRLPWLEKVLFCNSGAEAVEAAIKFSRFATRRAKIVYCDHAYHGVTYGALSVTGDPVFQKGFEPLIGDCARVPFNDAGALAKALAGNDVAAFIVEPIQGKGVNLPDDNYFAEVQRLCRKHGTLFVADEIQTGMGRTGRFAAVEHWGVEPDMLLLAKALSGGFVPVGSLLMRRWVFDKVFDRMDRVLVHGSTFSKIDLAMAAALATLTVYDDERLIERAAELGERLIDGLRRRLTRHGVVKQVRGKGMMIGIEFGPPSSLKLRAAYTLVESANKGLFCQLLLIPLMKKHHILSQVAGNNLPVIKFLPPFVIDETDVVWIEDALDAVITDSERVGGVWDLAKTLAGQALQARATG